MRYKVQRCFFYWGFWSFVFFDLFLLGNYWGGGGRTIFGSELSLEFPLDSDCCIAKSGTRRWVEHGLAAV
eukprot:6203343-Amphidinium_carterae.1